MAHPILKSIFYTIARALPARGPIVLMYHSIGNNEEFFTVRPYDFEMQMRYLKEQHYDVISLEQLIRALKAGEPLSKKTIVITIDDGYKDNYTHAWPILKHYGFPAAIFLITGSVGDSRQGRCGTELPMLNWQEIQEMATDGLIKFYPHTHTHQKLTTLSPAEARHEIAESQATLARHNLGGPVFAYPYGAFDDDTKMLVADCGFEAALGVRFGRADASEMLELKRNSIDSKITLPMFKGIVHFGRI